MRWATVGHTVGRHVASSTSLQPQRKFTPEPVASCYPVMFSQLPEGPNSIPITTCPPPVRLGRGGASPMFTCGSGFSAQVYDFQEANTSCSFFCNDHCEFGASAGIKREDYHCDPGYDDMWMAQFMTRSSKQVQRWARGSRIKLRVVGRARQQLHHRGVKDVADSRHQMVVRRHSRRCQRSAANGHQLCTLNAQHFAYHPWAPGAQECTAGTFPVVPWVSCSLGD